LEHREHRTTNPGVPPNTSPGQARRLLSLNEAATVLGLSKVSIRRLIWRAELPVVRITRRLQVDVRDLERLIEQAKDRIG